VSYIAKVKMNPLQTSSIQMEVPNSLIAQAQKLVDAGWFRDLDEIVLDALRRFLESHQEDLMEDFIRQDVEWSLTGDE
jgi:Arc/MetJ-type ribon-helix-helix transcriptional regulator